MDEFEYGLEMIGRSPSYRLVYLAFHGTPGRIGTDLFNITLDEMAQRMGHHFKDRVIHFGACSTLRCSENRIAAFLESTGAAMVTGFTVKVDWIESTAFDLLYLGLWKQYLDIAAFEKRLSSAYLSLIERLGFVMVRQ